MEDFSNILWLLVLAGSVAVSFASKAIEKRRKAASASPSQPKMPESIQQDEKMESPDFLPKENDGTAVYMGPADRLMDTSTALNKSRPSQGNDCPEKRQPDKKVCAESSAIFDFDLRKAVLWSEILKSKFDEE